MGQEDEEKAAMHRWINADVGILTEVGHLRYHLPQEYMGRGTGRLMALRVRFGRLPACRVSTEAAYVSEYAEILFQFPVVDLRDVFMPFFALGLDELRGDVIAERILDHAVLFQGRCPILRRLRSRALIV